MKMWKRVKRFVVGYGEIIMKVEYLYFLVTKLVFVFKKFILFFQKIY